MKLFSRIVRQILKHRRPMEVPTLCFVHGILLFLLSHPTLAALAQIPVRHAQGSSRAFLVLKDLSGRPLAFGDVIQVPHRSFISSRLVFHFRDGSVDDDLTTYSQNGVFRLIRDRHVQRGPSFPKPVDVTVDAEAGTITSRSAGEDGKEEVNVEHLKIPPEISNGLTNTILSNIAQHSPETELAYVSAGTTKSRLVHLAIHPAGMEPMVVAGNRRQAMHFVIHVELGGMAGMIAPMIGEQPDDLHVWVVEGEVPVIVAEQGQLFQGGPIWRVELASPTWPSLKASRP